MAFLEINDRLIGKEFRAAVVSLNCFVEKVPGRLKVAPPRATLPIQLSIQELARMLMGS
jgi:hypothetical protein